MASRRYGRRSGYSDDICPVQGRSSAVARTWLRPPATFACLGHAKVVGASIQNRSPCHLGASIKAIAQDGTQQPQGLEQTVVRNLVSDLPAQERSQDQAVLTLDLDVALDRRGLEVKLRRQFRGRPGPGGQCIENEKPSGVSESGQDLRVKLTQFPFEGFLHHGLHAQAGPTACENCNLTATVREVKDVTALACHMSGSGKVPNHRISVRFVTMARSRRLRILVCGAKPHSAAGLLSGKTTVAVGLWLIAGTVLANR